MSNVEIELLVLKSNTWNSLSVCLNLTIGITLEYLKPFGCVEINEYCWTE